MNLDRSKHQGFTLVRLILILLLTVSTSQGRPWFSGWSGSGSSSGKASTWSSMLNVDPSMLLSYMMRHGGLLIPKSIEPDIKIFAKTCHANQVQLNIVERKLLVKGFSVRLPEETEDALCIGRLCIHWDSYLRPCVEIEVDEVHVLVEFFNVLLSRSNWGDLRRNGFPPTFYGDVEDESAAADYDPESSFLRIGSIAPSGSITANMKSRPLRRDLLTVSFNMTTIRAIDRDIRNRALENLAKTGRRGCTTDELYTILQTYFVRKMQESLAEVIEDFAKDPSGSSNDIQRVSKILKESIAKYTKDAGASVNRYFADASEWTGEKLMDLIRRRLDEWEDSVGKSSDNPESFSKTAKNFVSKYFASAAREIDQRRFKQPEPKGHASETQDSK